MLKAGSPLLDSANFGRLVSSNGGKDYWGNSVSASSASVRGAYNGPGIDMIYEGESLTISGSSGDGSTVYTSPNASDGSYLRYNSNAVNDYVTFTVNVLTAGTYKVHLINNLKNDRGIYQLAINDGSGFTNVGSPVDLYLDATVSSFVAREMGTFTFASAGNKAFKMTVTGKDAASTGYGISLDAIVLEP